VCGIFAALSPRRPVGDALVETGVRALRHRGPDSERCWIAPDRQVGLGHARLSVIDHETGTQPLTNEDGSLQFVANGEFYDFERIRHDLLRRGHRLRTRSDSEIAVHLYEDHGPLCLAELRGEFAFVLWDGRNRQLFAARDRFGVKPLYYAMMDDCLYLASEAKALFAVGVPARWDHESFFQMCHLYYDQDRTLFAGVRQVPPGHYLRAARGKVEVVRYWDLDYPVQTAREVACPDDEHIRRTRDAFEEAVRLRLRADVPVACFLSGGLDSSAVLGVAVSQDAPPVDAFTIAFDPAAYDEHEIAAETAIRAGVKHTPVHATQTLLADHFADAVWHSETVNSNANGVAKYLLSKRAREAGYKVVLTGEGADEVLAGYAFLIRDMLLYGGPSSSPLETAGALRRLSGPGIPTGINGVPAVSTAAIRHRLGFLPSWIQWFSEAAAYARVLWSKEFRAEFAGRDPYDDFLGRLDYEGQLAGRAPVYQSLYLWNKSMFPNLLLNQLGDRVEMAHAIEGRTPFLDHHFVATVRDVPLSLQIRGIQDKYVLRQAVQPVITDTVYRRPKHPFIAPPAPLEPRGALYRMIQDLLCGTGLSATPFFDRAAIQRFLSAVPQLSARGEPILTGVSSQLIYLASICVLQERYRLAG
jgi:asparagine synthase (glutamine-hydrolysing)